MYGLFFLNMPILANTQYFYNNEPSKNKHFLILLSSLAKNSQAVRNHVKLLHVYKSRRGFSKGTVLCGGY